ncbi:MAG: prepilin-type N-terminal cleavage/methylation domain-containing protein [Sedimentisphaerales bacterium]|nr:prepilin-type N-terminal cleavage/methylation domain-containing protein [Sedimentisphaerales bacterium]
MNDKRKTYDGFTLIELLVAIGILAVVISFAGVIFNVSMDAQRTAMANAEIMQKFRAITNQLNSDFRGLSKQSEILVVWVARSLPSNADYEDNDLDGYERFDRIMFFTNGDFQSYKTNPMVRGNVARVCYQIARKDNDRPEQQDRTERTLARTQHIMTADSTLDSFLDPNDFSTTDWFEWNNRYEYDKMSPETWKRIPWQNKQDMLSVITDTTVGTSTVDEQIRGASVDPADANSIHMLLCEGVGEFKIQGWYEADQRWLPEVDPDGDGNLDDTHFYDQGDPNTPGVLYPYPPYGGVKINHFPNYPRDEMDEEHFGSIPGLGRALKFTFTLFDSKGIIKNGRTFTHIVYLDN